MTSAEAGKDQHQASEAYLAAVLETAVDGIIIINRRGLIHSVNRAACRIFGYNPDETIGRNVSMLMPSPYREQHNHYISRYLKTGDAHIIGIGREVQGLRKDGSLFPIDLAISEVRTNGDISFVGIIRDISERKEMEQAIVTASENERMQIGQDLHDALGQQMTGITLLAKTLERKLRNQKSPLAEDAADLAGLAADASAETKRLAHGAYPTELERHGLISALVELSENLHKLYRTKCSYVGRKEPVNLDRTTELHLYRIAQESSMNAIKHAEASEIKIDLFLDSGDLHLTISDNGRGISIAEAGRKRGMGLGIMRHRANLIDANLVIDTPPAGGTKVRCCIPGHVKVSTGAHSGQQGTRT